MAHTAASHGTHDAERSLSIGSTVAPRAFISEQTAGSLLRNALGLYRSNFRPLFLTYVLPTYPVLVLQMLTQVAPEPGALFVVFAMLGWFVSFFATSALTVTVSDICLGNEPTLRRAYGKLLKGRLWLKVLFTGLLQTLAVAVGFLLLLIPGLVLMVRLLPASAVVVLEGESGIKALKRAMSLSKGHYWRLLGLILLLSLLIFALVFVASLVFGFVLAAVEAVFGTGVLDVAIAVLLGALLQGVMYPLFFIAIVLLYYDLRARKEAYDVEMLSEDMMR